MASIQVKSPYICKASNLVQKRGKFDGSQSVLLKTIVGGSGITIVNNTDNLRISAVTSSGVAIGDIDLTLYYTKTESTTLYYSRSYVDTIINNLNTALNQKVSSIDLANTYLSNLNATHTCLTKNDATSIYLKQVLDTTITLGTTYNAVATNTDIINWSNAFANITIAGRITGNTLVASRVGSTTNTPSGVDKFEVILRTASLFACSRGGIVFYSNTSGVDTNVLELKTYAHASNGSLDFGIKTKNTSTPSIYIKDTVDTTGRGYVGILNISPTEALDVTGGLKVSGD